MSTDLESPDSPLLAPVPVASSFWSDLSLLGVVVIWGVNLPVMKVGLSHVEPFAFNASRLFLSAIVLGVFALLERTSIPMDRPRDAKKQILLYALTTSGLYQLIFLLAVTRTASGNGSLIMATVPMWTAILAWLWLGETLSKMARWGLAIAFLGTMIVALEKGIRADRTELAGNFLFLLAALLWAWGTVQSRTVLKFISPMRLSAVSTAMMLPLHLAFGGWTIPTLLPKLGLREVWIPLLYAGVLSTGFALPMWNYGVRHAGAAHAAVFQNLVPIVAIASAWVVRGEPVTQYQIIGGVLIISGLVLVRRGK